MNYYKQEMCARNFLALFYCYDTIDDRLSHEFKRGQISTFSSRSF